MRYINQEMGLLPYVMLLPGWLKPMTLRRGTVFALGVLSVITASDILDSISEIGVECSRSKSDRERVLTLTSQIACQLWPDDHRLSMYCKAGAAMMLVSHLLTVLMCVYGFILMSTPVPHKNYLFYLNLMVGAYFLENSFSAVHAWNMLYGGMDRDKNNPCYDNGLSESVYLSGTNGDQSQEAMDNVVVETSSAVLSFMLCFVLSVFTEHVGMGSDSEEIIEAGDALDLIQIPKPALFLSSSFFGRPLVSAAALTGATLLVISLGQVLMFIVRSFDWCRSALKLERTVCGVYSPIVGVEATATLCLGMFVSIYILKSSKMKKLNTVYKLTIMAFFISLISTGIGLALAGKHYPTFLLQNMSVDFALGALKMSALVVLGWILYSLRMLRIAGGTGIEPIRRADELILKFFEKTDDTSESGDGERRMSSGVQSLIEGGSTRYNTRSSTRNSTTGRRRSVSILGRQD